MEPNAVEQESQLAAQLLFWLAGKVPLTFILPSWTEDAAKSIYGNREQLDCLTQLLCQGCEETPDEVIYNGRDATARKLADWWDAHKEADAAKEDHEAYLHNRQLSKDMEYFKGMSDERRQDLMTLTCRGCGKLDPACNCERDE
jgi:hypothetical protein